MKKRFVEVIWDVGFRDRGLGHGDFAVLVKKTGELVVECPNLEVAQHIVEMHNLLLREQRPLKQRTRK